MPLAIRDGLPTVLVKKSSYERAGIERSELDAAFNLTDEEFRVEGELVAIGPLPSDEMIGSVLDFFEARGLSYYDDVFELSGNWPGWFRLYVM